eukprot:UN26750
MFYFEVRSEKEYNEEILSEIEKVNSVQGSFLDTSSTQMLTEIEIENIKAAEEASLQQAAGPDKSNVDREFEDSEQMWVDQYQPENFVDLLSHDKTNREALKWLKAWDKVVFP